MQLELVGADVAKSCPIKIAVGGTRKPALVDGRATVGSAKGDSIHSQAGAHQRNCERRAAIIRQGTQLRVGGAARTQVRPPAAGAAVVDVVSIINDTGASTTILAAPA